MKGGRLVLVLLGRRDWQVKVNGQRVAIEEVEQSMQSVLKKGVLECCCALVASPTTGEAKIGAAVVLETLCCEEDLRYHAHGVQSALQQLLELYLPVSMIPTYWLIRPAACPLPLTPTGKRDRNAVAILIRTAAAAPLQAAGPAPAEQCVDHLYDVVRREWEAYLGFEVDSCSNFFHCGGDSLGAVRLLRRLYLSIRETDEGIDCNGRLPAPFQVHVLMRYPRLGDYVLQLREELGEEFQRDKHRSNPVTPRREPLMNAVSAGCVGLVEVLLNHHLCNVDGHNDREHLCSTPLHLAVGALPCNLAMVQLLIEHGAKTTVVTRDGVTPAHLAAERSLEILQLLLEHGAAVRCRDGARQSLLHFAARAGCTDCVRFLLRHPGTELTTRDKWQRTAAHWAVLHGHKAVLTEMVAYVAEGRGGGVPAWSKKAPQRGTGKERLSRLAKRTTSMPYESLDDICQRLWASDEEMHDLCSQIAGVIEV